ncbi:MAG: GNAT family N-acetyltransferase [Ginsengibacter sp.]
MNISYIPQQDIDKVKWDRCIAAAGNSLIYAYSFYLDTMSRHWDALVSLTEEGDYEMAMPLTWNKKYGLHYLYQPFFTASLGIFGNNISAEVVKLFLDAIPQKFKYWDFYLNKKNAFAIDGYEIYERRNYILSLEDSHENILAKYAKNHLRNIRRAKEAGNEIQTGIAVEKIIALAREQAKDFSPVAEKDFENFALLFSILKEKNLAVTYGIYSSQQQLVASCVWFFSKDRAYYILVGNHPNGRTSGASHLLIDAFIQDHAGEKLTLDFEGSDLKNLAWFYSSFGAVEEKYAGIKLNRLPTIAKLFRQ